MKLETLGAVAGLVVIFLFGFLHLLAAVPHTEFEMPAAVDEAMLILVGALFTPAVIAKFRGSNSKPKDGEGDAG